MRLFAVDLSDAEIIEYKAAADSASK